MIRVSEVIIVEGRYDKNTLGQIIDAVIIETSGFAVFKNKEKLRLIRRLARQRGIIVLTDSDGAGFMIRNFLKGAVDPALVKHAYIPDIHGKEKRKSAPSGEGKLGVEGMKPQVLIDALSKAGATLDRQTGPEREERISKADLYLCGLSGKRNSAAKRRALLRALDLPERLSSNAMLDILNALMNRDAFFETAASLFGPLVQAEAADESDEY